MGKTNKGSKGPGHEYWKSRLHKYGEIPGKETKVRTHKKERREAKNKLDEQRADPAG